MVTSKPLERWPTSIPKNPSLAANRFQSATGRRWPLGLKLGCLGPRCEPAFLNELISRILLVC